MNATKSLSVVPGYLGANLTQDEREHRSEISYPAITITRQTGSRAISIAKEMPNVLHVRLVGSEETRSKRLSWTQNVSSKAANSHIRKQDLQRQHYASVHFECSDVDDPTLYDLCLKTDNISDEAAVEIIAATLKAKAPGPIRLPAFAGS